MKCLLLPFALFLSLYIVNGEENCDKLGVTLYEDIACQAVKKSGETCPSSFDCSSRVVSDGHCRFSGRNIPLNSPIDNELTYPSCNVGCYCKDKPNKFICAVLDCPEWIGAPLNPGCYRKYEVGKCCSTGQICEPFDDKAVCEVNGVKYREGERFTPKDKCVDCVCQKGFKGEFVAPFCRRTTCSVELRRSEELKKNCAPVYYGDSDDLPLCCPNSWICPEAVKDLKITPDNSGDDKKVCSFGEHKIKGNELFNAETEEFGKKRPLTCKCILPPFVTCTGRW